MTTNTKIPTASEYKRGVDLFETPDLIPFEVQSILDEYEEDFCDGNYRGLSEALTRLEKIGYTFDYYLDGVAYDLRPIGMLGKCACEIEFLDNQKTTHEKQ